jgi:hypothetical protein
MEADFSIGALPEDGPLIRRNTSGGKRIVHLRWKILWNSCVHHVQYIKHKKDGLTRKHMTALSGMLHDAMCDEPLARGLRGNRNLGTSMTMAQENHRNA